MRCILLYYATDPRESQEECQALCTRHDRGARGFLSVTDKLRKAVKAQGSVSGVQRYGVPDEDLVFCFASFPLHFISDLSHTRASALKNLG